MNPLVLITCPRHPTLAECGDDRDYQVETVAAARALYEAEFGPGSSERKVAYVVLRCEPCQDSHRLAVRADSVSEARAAAARHRRGWYTARRAGGRVVDVCQWHLGTCCMECLGKTRWGVDRVDPTAILPWEQAGSAEQLDLFGWG